MPPVGCLGEDDYRMNTDTLGSLQVARVDAPSMITILRENPQLVAGMSYPSFFCTHGWLDAVLQASEPKDPFGLVVYRADHPIAVLPLEKTRNWLGGIDLRFLGYRFHPDPLGLICAECDRTQAMAALITYLNDASGWDRLILDWVLPDEASQWPGESRQQSVAPYLTLPANFEALLAGFNGKKRYKLRNKIRRAEEANLEFCVAESTGDKSAYLHALFELHDRRSAAIGRDSSLQRKHVKALHTRLLDSCQEATLLSLKHKNRFIAVTYGFLSHKRFLFYQIAHDPEYNELRPGTVIVAKTISTIQEAGASEFNFLQGNEEYKFEWTSHTRALRRVCIYAPRVRATLLTLVAHARTRLLHGIRKLRSSIASARKIAVLADR
jgi:CelD/BcsL family acetyltransferase involved in cellulose biosynthesis